MTDADATAPFRLAYVPGVTPAKWVRTWTERLPDVPLALVTVTVAEAPDALRNGDADAALLRLPMDRTGLSAIPLYSETTVVVFPKDHELAAADEVSLDELTDYLVLHPLDDPLEWEDRPGLAANERPATTADAVELVAAGVGLLIVPQSLARLHHRRDLTYRPMPDAPQSRVALSWLEEQTTDLVEEFIGIVRGRTVNSSRGRASATSSPGTPATPAAREQQKRPQSGSARAKPAAGKTGKPGKSGSGGSKSGKAGKPRRRS